MENKLTEKLRQYGTCRSLLLDLIFRYIPKATAENNTIFHTLLATCTIIVIISVFNTTRRLTLFSLHPVFMTIGTIIFLAEGIISYRNSTLLDFLSPIMQHNKKVKARAIHQSLQTTGAIFLALGLLFIMSHKLENEKSLIPMTPHSILGSIAAFLIIVQVTTGQDKIAQLESANRRVRRWHGEAGLLLWDLLCVTLLLGLLSFLPLFSFVTLLALLLVAAVWVAVHAQMLGSQSLHKYDSAYDMESSSDAVSLSREGGIGGGGNNTALGLTREESFGNPDIEMDGAVVTDESELIAGSHNAHHEQQQHSSGGVFGKARLRD